MPTCHSAGWVNLSWLTPETFRPIPRTLSIYDLSPTVPLKFTSPNRQHSRTGYSFVHSCRHDLSPVLCALNQTRASCHCLYKLPITHNSRPYHSSVPNGSVSLRYSLYSFFGSQVVANRIVKQNTENHSANCSIMRSNDRHYCS